MKDMRTDMGILLVTKNYESFLFIRIGSSGGRFKVFLKLRPTLLLSMLL